jgi:hypothetical protein
MRAALVLSATLFAAQLIAIAPAAAQTVEELKAELAAREAELAAQLQISALQRQRIETLEAELSGRRIAAAPTSENTPERAAGDPEEEGALERALVRRGTAVLPPYTVEVTPSFAWSHSGSDFNSSTQNSYIGGLDGRIGLPGGWMLGASVPFFHRDVSGVGDNTGIGDISATVWKSLWAQDGSWPSLVGSLRYGAPTGEDFSDDAVPLGSGFHRLTGRLSSVKTVDPIAFFGNVSYTHFLGETISGVNVDRSGVIGFGLGASLAVTPEITVSTGINFAFEEEVKVNGTKINGSDATIGVVDLGVGILLTKDVFLTFNGAFGITDDSPDVLLGMSVPIRF